MAKSTTAKTNFTLGELSGRALGRFDLAKYPNGVKKMENFLGSQVGSAQFRPGTRFVAETKDSSKKSRLIPFQYSSDQDYVMEVGDQYIRLYDNSADLLTISQGFDSYTKFLSHFDGDDASTNIIDEIGHIITSHNTAQLDTAQFKFGTASLLLNGSNDWLSVPASADWNFGTGDFTIDCWIRLHAAPSNTNSSIASQNSGANDYWWFYLHDEGGGNYTLRFFDRNSGVDLTVTSSSQALSLNTWYHVAMVRYGTDWRVYLNGTSIGSTTQVHTCVTSVDVLAIGDFSSGGDYFLNGWIDELRISKGIARWTANFTAPTTPYAPISSTEIVSPYVEADIFGIQVAQSNDVMYLVHPDYSPYKLSRTGSAAFALAQVPIVRGPLMDKNITDTTITASGDTGAGITLTASTAIFHSTHVGSLWRIKSGMVKITAYTSVFVVTADVQNEPDGSAGNLATGPGATTDWAEGAFSDYRGWPAAVTFHEQRLIYANTTTESDKFWGSYLEAYDNFSTTATTDDFSYAFKIATDQRNAILWMSSSKTALTMGTNGGSFSVSSGTTGYIITPTKIQINRDTNYGVAPLMPKRISSFLYYVQRTLLKVRELSYNFYLDTQISNDMTLLADHILRDGSGVVDMDHQQSPNDRLWCVRSDGQIAVLTRNPEQDVMGWARIVAGTDSTSAGKFESVAVIPKNDTDDQVWVIVKRTLIVGGVATTKRYIEYFTPENFTYDWDPVQLDCSLTLDKPDVITAVSKAAQVVVSYTAGLVALNNADQIRIDNVVGMTQLNGNSYLVSDLVLGVSFKLKTLAGVYVDSTAYSTYISGGQSRKMVTAISGLAHLEGETIQVQTDGSVPATNSFLVTGGAITLASKAAVVHAGLPYTGTLQLLKFSDGSNTTGQGKMRRSYLMTLRLNRSASFLIGKDANSLDTITLDITRDPGIVADNTVLFTGDMEVPLSMGWSKTDEIVISQQKPLALMILACMTQSEVETKD